MSRYKKTPKVRRKGNLFYGLRPGVNTAHRGDDTYYTSQTGDSFHSLAHRLYGDVRLWWVIAEFNDVEDPFNDLVPGTTLRLPSRARLHMEVLR